MTAVTNSTMSNIYKVIEKSLLPTEKFLFNAMEWRDENPVIVRRVVCGAVLLTFGIHLIIDAVASLALAIITAPLELVGIQLAKSLAKRTFIFGMIGAASLIFFQFKNIFDPKLID